MSNLIKVKLPINAGDKSNLLSIDIDYLEPLLKTTYLRDIFVNRSGICLHGLSLVKESVPPYPNRRESFHKIGLVSRLTRRTNRINNDTPYLIVHNIWSGGYYHWMTESLVKLWSVRDKCTNCTLLLPSHTKIQPVIEETVKAFGYSNIEYFPRNKNLKLRKLLLVNNSLRQAEYNVTAILKMSKILRSRYKLRNTNFGERIYITRESASRRKVSNESDVVKLLKNRGFVVIKFEDFNFGDQVSIMTKAKVAISIHGAALTNTMFMNKGGYVLELYKEILPVKDSNRLTPRGVPSYCYRRLAPITGKNYLIQFCTPENPNDSVDKANLAVDLKLLDKNLRLMNC